MIKKTAFTFPLIFEALIWLIYVTVYKYSYQIDNSGLPHIPNNDFPYLSVCLYSICTTLYLIPYYRWAVPRLLDKKRYGWLVISALLLITIVNLYNKVAWGWLFAQFTEGEVVHRFFFAQYHWQRLDLNLVLTDLLAFFCIAFARYSYQNEERRRRAETDHLQLQLSLLKTQLQPHFLFNTLNGLYGMSLTGSADTPRFILLLSQMMQYILYDCDKEWVSLSDELDFLTGYFELEQKKFPAATIKLSYPEGLPDILIPPLLFLPLVENSFKHGRHKIADEAGVSAELTITADQLNFRISNDTMNAAKKGPGGIGLVNIRKRLELYYPGKYQLQNQNDGSNYTSTLSIRTL